MQKRWTWMLIMLMATMLVVGCSDDDDPVVPEPTNFELVADEIEAYLPTIGGTYITAESLNPMVVAKDAAVTVFDIRTADHYADGHIKGAINATLGGIVDAVEAEGLSTTDHIVITCYTGQSAGHAVTALRLLGYENAQTLKFGMSSWNANVPGSRWAEPEAGGTNGSCADFGTANVSTTATTATVTYDYPTVGTLEEQVDVILSGFQGISASSLDPTDTDTYFIVSYLPENHYMGTEATPGHLVNAVRFNPGDSLDREAMLDLLPTDKTIVVYCYTGQTSSQVTAALNALGYTAKSLKYGMNNLFYNNEAYTHGTKWTDTNCKGYDLYDNNGDLIE